MPLLDEEQKQVEDYGAMAGEDATASYGLKK